MSIQTTCPSNAIGKIKVRILENIFTRIFISYRLIFILFKYPEMICSCQKHALLIQSLSEPKIKLIRLT